MGIAIGADIFMGAIEIITAMTYKTKRKNFEGEEEEIEVLVWNISVANLTLMSLGNSAPEILLSVIEGITTLGSKPGELGPSTIVGSAAYNLLVIPALSILAAGTTIKRVEKLSVLVLTTCSALFAYAWLYICL